MPKSTRIDRPSKDINKGDTATNRVGQLQLLDACVFALFRQHLSPIEWTEWAPAASLRTPSYTFALPLPRCPVMR